MWGAGLVILSRAEAPPLSWTIKDLSHTSRHPEMPRKSLATRRTSLGSFWIEGRRLRLLSGTTRARQWGRLRYRAAGPIDPGRLYQVV